MMLIPRWRGDRSSRIGAASDRAAKDRLTTTRLSPTAETKYFKAILRALSVDVKIARSTPNKWKWWEVNRSREVKNLLDVNLLERDAASSDQNPH